MAKMTKHKVKRIRKVTGLSQRGLAQKLDMHRSTFNFLEMGARDFPENLAQDIVKALEEDIAAIKKIAGI